MYESFFNLAAKPFELVPNPDFLFLSKSHKRAITYLDYGIRERAGFILLTGEVGSGKTTLLRDLIKKNHESIVLSKIFNTKVSSEQLIAMINDDFGIPATQDKIAMLRSLNDFLIDQYTRGNQPVLIIDEAQNLSSEILEEVRLLSNLETDNAKLLQIILAGQPELRKTLETPELLQLRQRISINCHIQPLCRIEIEQYILHRLEKAGDREAVKFTPAAFDIIFKYSRGIPRLVNIICDFLLLAAFAEEEREIGETVVREVIGDLDFENQYWSKGEMVVPSRGDYSSVVSMQSGPDEETIAILKELNRRCESLERETAQLGKTLVEIANRNNCLQYSLTSHLQETEAFNAEVRSRVENARLVAGRYEGERARRGLIRRMLGI